MTKHIRFFEYLYLFVLLVIIILIALTPSLIGGDFSFFTEEMIEGIMIVVLFSIGYFAMIFYQQEATKNTNLMIQLKVDKNNLENRLEETFRYVGTLNIQMAEMRSLLSDIKKYPENKKDFKDILDFLAAKALGIVPVKWVVLRLVEADSLRTVMEQTSARGDEKILNYKFSNQDLINGSAGKECLVFNSHQNNLKTRAFCVIPRHEISREEKTLIKGIVSQIEMFYLIFSSLSNNHNNE
ncbi:MAG: hypothetical protein WCV41_03195 [Patescibacteria group bacterium]